jgi:hypothetical protein
MNADGFLWSNSNWGLVRLPCLLLGFATAVLAADHGQIRGLVTDQSGAAIPNAAVRLIPPDYTPVHYRGKAGPDGVFRIDGVSPGRYSLRAGLLPFRENSANGITVRAGETTDVGTIMLGLLGCDAPNIICDYITPNGEPTPPVNVQQGHLNLRDSCGADFDRGEVSCPETAARFRLNTDVWLTHGKDGAVYLTPANGALVTPPNQCSSKYDKNPIRIDTLGPGSDLCVRTSEGHTAHVMIVDEVDADTVLKLYYVTTR